MYMILYRETQSNFPLCKIYTRWRGYIGRRQVKVDGNYLLERLFSVNELRSADYTRRYLLRE